MSEQEPKIIGFVKFQIGSYAHQKCEFPKCQNTVEFAIPLKPKRLGHSFYCLEHFLIVWQIVKKKVSYNP